VTVYVDNMRRRQSINGSRPAYWSHMLADTHEELMSMAAEMGLRPEWLQHPGTHREHFDVTDTKRAQAVGFGAVQINYPHDTGRILAAKRAATTEESTHA
jgi:hypothetical protein